MPTNDRRSLPDRLWFGTGGFATAARGALTPLAWAYAALTGMRNRLYDSGALRTHALPVPAISVGNLSVGGTGKTPVAAWIAGELRRRGASPAILLRGYGDDEPIVHASLTPGAPVVAAPDRVAGVAEAVRQGADVAVLDDAFQHRRAGRTADVVLVSADRWTGRIRTLPAGPFREGLASLRRANLVIVTRKAATDGAVAAVRSLITRAVPGTQLATARLALGDLVATRDAARRPLATVAGRDVLAVCGVGDPHAFGAQLAQAGARVVLRVFPDHHAYGPLDASRLAAEAVAVAGAASLVVCTLKDAVKLSRYWPGDAPGLWYVSQHVILESGREGLDRLLDTVLAARTPAAVAAG